MRDLLSWNLSLGRWAGVHVRLHAFFLLFSVVAVHLSTTDPQDAFPLETLIALGVLLLSVLAHEYGHCVAAWKVGGSADQILIWPLGGLAHVNVTHEPQQEMATALAGPLVNFSICMLVTPLVLWLGGDLRSLVNPFVPPIAKSPWLDAASWVFWINWLLALVNLLPAFPLDGGRVLRSLLWPKYGYRTSVLRVAQVAKLTALVLCVAAIFVHERYPFASLPLALFGIFLFFSAKQEAERLQDQDSDDGVFGYDFSQGYTSLEKATPTPPHHDTGPIRKFFDTRREARRIRQQELEAEEERRVDEVLARLHEQGLDGLSEEDRALLSRVSARYRNRQRG